MTFSWVNVDNFPEEEFFLILVLSEGFLEEKEFFDFELLKLLLEILWLSDFERLEAVTENVFFFFSVNSNHF